MAVSRINGTGRKVYSWDYSTRNMSQEYANRWANDMGITGKAIYADEVGVKAYYYIKITKRGIRAGHERIGAS